MAKFGAKARTEAYRMIAPRTCVMTGGPEKGVVHYLYTRALLRKDFSPRFRILDVHKDGTWHYCLLARKTP